MLSMLSDYSSRKTNLLSKDNVMYQIGCTLTLIFLVWLFYYYNLYFTNFIVVPNKFLTKLLLRNVNTYNKQLIKHYNMYTKLKKIYFPSYIID